jgi:hypothetical protein
MRRRSRFEVGWQDWAVAIALGAIALLLAALALVLWGGWSHQRDVARAMEPPPVAAPVTAAAPGAKPPAARELGRGAVPSGRERALPPRSVEAARERPDPSQNLNKQPHFYF